MGCLKAIIDFIKGLFGLAFLIFLGYLGFTSFFPGDESKENSQGETVQLTKEERNKKIIEDKGYIIRATTSNILEEIHGEVIENNQTTIAVYSSEEVVNLRGEKFPVSFMVTGKAETKQGKIFNYAMAIGYKSEEEFKGSNPIGHLLEYRNYKTGKEIINLPEEKSIIKGMQNLAKEMESGQ